MTEQLSSLGNFTSSFGQSHSDTLKQLQSSVSMLAASQANTLADVQRSLRHLQKAAGIAASTHAGHCLALGADATDAQEKIIGMQADATAAARVAGERFVADALQQAVDELQQKLGAHLKHIASMESAIGLQIAAANKTVATFADSHTSHLAAAVGAVTTAMNEQSKALAEHRSAAESRAENRKSEAQSDMDALAGEMQKLFSTFIAKQHAREESHVEATAAEVTSLTQQLSVDQKEFCGRIEAGRESTAAFAQTQQGQLDALAEDCSQNAADLRGESDDVKRAVSDARATVASYTSEVAKQNQEQLRRLQERSALRSSIIARSAEQSAEAAVALVADIENRGAQLQSSVCALAETAVDVTATETRLLSDLTMETESAASKLQSSFGALTETTSDFVHSVSGRGSGDDKGVVTFVGSAKPAMTLSRRREGSIF